MQKRFLAFGLLIGLSLTGALSVAAPKKPPKKATDIVAGPGSSKVKNPNSRENYDRQVDKVALDTQKIAEKKIHELIKKYQGTRRIPELLLRLADVHQQAGAIQFRIAHAKAHYNNGPLDLKDYNTTLKSIISTTQQLIRGYPDHTDSGRAYFMQAKAREELEQKKDAKSDYLAFTQKFPEAPEVPLAYMALAQFAIEDNHHQEAIGYLLQVEKKPEHPQYPYALYKLAWSYYNLGEISKALSYLESHIIYYNSKFEVETGYSQSDLAIRDTSLLDTAVFYYEGFAREPGSYAVSKALPYFKSLESGITFGKMLERFAKVLRTNGKTEALLEWQNVVAKGEPRRPESMEVALIAFEHLWNQKLYPEMPQPLQSIIALYETNKTDLSKFDAYQRSQNVILDKANELRTSILKNKDKGNALKVWSEPLANLYDTFTKIVKETDPRVPAVHYNLAETLFAIGRFEESTFHYRWIVNKWTNAWAVKDGVQLEDSSLKAIASRYEVFKTKDFSPKKLEVKNLDENSKNSMDPLLTEWLAWIDWHESHFSKDFKKFDSFLFESARSLYYKNYLEASLQRLLHISRAYPTSLFAVPAGSLVLDTYVKNARWKDARDLAHEYLKVQNWNDPQFKTKIFSVAADSSYKLMETDFRDKKYLEVVTAFGSFETRYPGSPRIQDALYLAARASESTKDLVSSGNFYQKLIKTFPKSEHLPASYLSSGKIGEALYRFSDAASDYLAYTRLPKDKVKMSESELTDLRKKIVHLGWISGDRKQLITSLESPEICNKELEVFCNRYLALNSLQTRDRKPEELMKLALNAPRDNRPIWAAAALEQQEALRYPDRLLLSKQVAGRWNDLEPDLQLALLPKVSISIPKSFELNRQDIDRLTPLKSSEKSITHRVAQIKEIEESAKSSMKLPWARIRARVMLEIAQLYIDFSKSLSQLAPPKGLPENEAASYQETIQKLVLPFEEKGQELRSKSFEIASTNSIEDSDFVKIANLFFADNPSQASQITGGVKSIEPIRFSHKTLRRLDPKGLWETINLEMKLQGEVTELYLKSRWSLALKEQKWQQVSYFLQELKDRNLTTSSGLALMRAVTLAYAGARAEALKELLDVRSQLGDDYRNQATVIALSHYIKTFSKEATLDWIKKLEDESSSHLMKTAISNEREAFLLSYGIAWTQAKVSDRNRMDLLLMAQKSDNNDESYWARTELRRIQQLQDPTPKSTETKK